MLSYKRMADNFENCYPQLPVTFISGKMGVAIFSLPAFHSPINFTRIEAVTPEGKKGPLTRLRQFLKVSGATNLVQLLLLIYLCRSVSSLGVFHDLKAILVLSFGLELVLLLQWI